MFKPKRKLTAKQIRLVEAWAAKRKTSGHALVRQELELVETIEGYSNNNWSGMKVNDHDSSHL